MLNASSQQIRHFEDELGTALFKRSSRRVELTPAGTGMLPAPAPSSAQSNRPPRSPRDRPRPCRHPRHRHDRLDPAGAAGALVREFSATYPQINVRLHELSPGEQHAALVSRRTDISFLRRPPDDTDFVTELGWTERLGVALQLRHPLAGAKTHHPQ